MTLWQSRLKPWRQRAESESTAAIETLKRAQQETDAAAASARLQLAEKQDMVSIAWDLFMQFWQHLCNYQSGYC